jgi:hypothetical protein
VSIIKTQVHHFTPKKKSKTMPSARKVLLLALWDAQDILLLKFLDHRATMNANHC